MGANGLDDDDAVIPLLVKSGLESHVKASDKHD